MGRLGVPGRDALLGPGELAADRIGVVAHEVAACGAPLGRRGVLQLGEDVLVRAAHVAVEGVRDARGEQVAEGDLRLSRAERLDGRPTEAAARGIAAGAEHVLDGFVAEHRELVRVQQVALPHGVEALARPCPGRGA